jgi:flagellar biosynthesis/type III secretory pathway M-ring protein FliF/YscJ
MPFSEKLTQNTTRRRFLVQLLTVAGVIAVPIFGFCQTRGMERRQDRREDGADRTEQRGDKMEERADDPIGVRGPERREDRRDLREDRHDDRRERIY